MTSYRPSEVALAMTIHANDLKLINLARIAHKYQFNSTEQWCADLLSCLYLVEYKSLNRSLQALTTYHSNTSSTSSLSGQNLVQITELAILCDSNALLQAAISRWKRLLGEGRAVAVAIGLSERLNLRSLEGLAYHTMMLKGRERWDVDPQLNRAQRIRLLSGYYNLTKKTEALPNSPPRFTHDHSCMRKGLCNKTWGACWKAITSSKGGLTEQVMVFQTPDLLGRVMMAESFVKAFVEGGADPDGMLDDMHEKCVKTAWKAAQDRVKEVQDDLVNCFSDVK